MVIDSQVVIVGSFNYTGPATSLNDENIIVIGDLESTSQQSKQRQKKLAGFAAKEIDRIIETFGQDVN
jgi:phosphatidylserine/phosphatidylglycerophosphate/cardiolipin synthase-like enzyme